MSISPAAVIQESSPAAGVARQAREGLLQEAVDPGDGDGTKSTRASYQFRSTREPVVKPHLSGYNIGCTGVLKKEISLRAWTLVRVTRWGICGKAGVSRIDRGPDITVRTAGPIGIPIYGVRVTVGCDGGGGVSSGETYLVTISRTIVPLHRVAFDDQSENTVNIGPNVVIIRGG